MGQRFGKKITPSFGDMIDYYLSEPHVKSGIDELGESSVGSGFFLTGDNEDALEIAKGWAHDINLDGMNLIIAREHWATGNVILENVEPNNLQRIVHLPIDSFEKAIADDKGIISHWLQSVQGKKTKLPIGRLTHMKWNPIGVGVVGRGLLEPLLRTGMGYEWQDQNGEWQKDYRPPYRQIIEEIEDAMRKILRRYVPRFAFVFRGVDDETVKGHAKVIGGVRPEDDLTFGLPSAKQELLITRMSTDPRSRLHPYFEYFYNALITGLETPSIRLFLEAGFTEASSKTAKEIREFVRFVEERLNLMME